MMDPALVRSGDAVMAYGENLEIRVWNRAAEKLTGIPASEAIGRHCWEVLCGVDEAGGTVCHAGCARPRLARDGWPLTTHSLLIKTSEGRRRIALSTISLGAGDERLHLNILRPAQQPAPEGHPLDQAALPVLTARQLEVLEFLAQGMTAKSIAARLCLSATTVRNHIHAILLALGCHSQLEAVVTARRCGVLQ
jgi:PAS domain S-box-containing protein